MSLFSNMTTEGMEQVKDSLGGFSCLESDVYPAKIKAVYITTSAKGAMAANLIADVHGREYREQIWITNAKGECFFTNKQTGNKVPLPGFTTINDLCICAVGKPLNELDTADKTFKLYDYEAKTELPKSVPTITDLCDTEVLLGIIKQIVDKNVKDDAGNYVPSGETREENVIDKVFNAETKMTVNEAASGKTEGIFITNWEKKNKGQVRNRAKGKKAEGAAVGGAPQKPAVKSLFG